MDAIGDLISAICEGFASLVESIIGLCAVLIERPSLIGPVLLGVVATLGLGYYFVSDAITKASNPAKVEAISPVPTTVVTVMPTVKHITKQEATALKAKVTRKAKDFLLKHTSVN